MNSIQLDIEKTVCFTGHRPNKLGGFLSPNSTEALVAERTKYLIGLFLERGYTNFISGGAQGFDTIAAREVWKKRQTNKDIKLIIAVPFRGQEDRWPLQARITYDAMLREADEVVYLSEDNSNAAYKMQQRNEWMVDHSSAIIACWDGSNGGGTANCVRYAKQKGKAITTVVPPLFVS